MQHRRSSLYIFSAARSPKFLEKLYMDEKRFVCAVAFFGRLAFLENCDSFLFLSDPSQRCLARGLGTESRPRPTLPPSGSPRRQVFRSESHNKKNRDKYNFSFQLERPDTGQYHTNMRVTGFEPDVFRCEMRDGEKSQRKNQRKTSLPQIINS